VSVVALDFADLLATGQARRTARTLLLTGPVIGVLWLLTLAPGQAPNALLLRIPALGLVVVSGLVAALLALVPGGPGGHLRHLRLAPCRAAAAACAAAAVCDIVVLVTATLSALEQHLTTRWAPGLIAVTASLLRLTLTQRVARRDLLRSPSPE
jgi:hypothetical protein